MTNLHPCAKCPNKATWYYMPSSIRKIEADYYYCDDHIHRGCSCMWITKQEYEYPGSEKWLIQEPVNVKLVKLSDTHYEYRDLMDRQLPCCEYDYCEDGFEFEIENE